MYICHRSGANNSRGQNFDVNRNLLSLWSFATSFKKISLKSDFIQFFHDFIHVYSPGTGADNPLGMKFWCQQEHLVTSVICCKFQKNLFEVWFYTNVFMILYMYIAPGHGQTAPRGQILMSTERPYHFTHLFQVSKKSLSGLILYNFFHDLIHVYTPGQGQAAPRDKILMSTEMSFYSFVASFKTMSFKSDFIHFFSWFNTCI